MVSALVSVSIKLDGSTPLRGTFSASSSLEKIIAQLFNDNNMNNNRNDYNSNNEFEILFPLPRRIVNKKSKEMKRCVFMNILMHVCVCILVCICICICVFIYLF